MKATVISVTENRVDVRIRGSHREAGLDLYHEPTPHDFNVGDVLEVTNRVNSPFLYFIQRLHVNV